MLSEATKREEKAITKANIEWRKRCVAEARIKAKQAEIDELVKFLRSSRLEAKKAKEETVYYAQLVSKWSLWWDRVKARASSKTLSLIYKLGRRPPASKDCGWGGGQ